MKFSVNQKIFEKWPQVKIGVVFLLGMENHGHSEEILKLLRREEEKGKTELSRKDFNLMPEVTIWKEVYKNFGSNPHEYRSSVEALLRRVRSGNPLPQINNLVDLYNFLSIKHHVPAGAEDIDKVQDDIELAFAKGNEQGKYIGSKNIDTCYEGEVIYKDSAGFICRRWNWREGDRTKIEENTQNAVLVFEAMPPVKEEQLQTVINESVQLIKKYLGGKQEVFIVTKDGPFLEVDFTSGGKALKEEKAETPVKVKTLHPGSMKKALTPSVLGVKPLKALPPKEFVSYEIIQALYTAVKNCYPDVELNPEDIHLEHPVEEEHGDYASNMALQVKGQRSKVKGLESKNPREIAEKIVKELRVILGSEATPESKQNDSGQARMTKDIISKIEIAGQGFINFWLREKFLLQKLEEIENNKETYGKSNWGVGKKWLIEHTSPNPNKALHLGHLRNNITGMAIANTWESIGISVIRDCIDNNRGIAIAKLMWGYLKFARKDKKQNTDINYWYDHQDEWQTPQDRKLRVDRFVDELYTLGAQDFETNKASEEAVRKLLVDWENEDKKNWTLWKKVLSYSYQGQELTLKRLGNKWDKVWHEHKHYKMGKNLVDKGLKLGIFKKTSEGTILTDLKKFGLPDTVVIKSDGTALYITQDLALTKLKRDTFHPDKLHWVIGPEQSLALKQMYAVCEQLGIGKVSDYVHIAYGYMSIKGKGKMSSRLGNVVYIDDLLDEAKARIKKIMNDARYKKLFVNVQGEKIVDLVAEKLGIGAVKYSILKFGRWQDIAFDFEQSLSFEGNSGPYLQYTYARAKSVLSKNRTNTWGVKPQSPLGCKCKKEELAILRTLYKFPEVVLSAAQNYAPNLICSYLFDLAQKFNTFYDKLPILKAEKESREVRLKITEATAQVIRNGLRLLGIETPEKM